MSLPSAVDIVADRSYDRTHELMKAPNSQIGDSIEIKHQNVALNLQQAL